ncbi:MAG TPA: 3'-5' exonuclease [Tepidisphaeraceae bacterium]|nr:3'-5' exonuclease [Tepidisphaeraceae bacterium]
MQELGEETVAKLLVFDTETGGIDPQFHSILSLGAVVWEDGSILDEIEVPIAEASILATPEALAVNKINLDEHKRMGCAPADAMIRFQAFLTKNFSDSSVTNKICLAAHNADFDIGFLKRFYRLANVDYESVFSHRVIDTISIIRFLNLAKKLTLRDAGLSEAIKYFGIEVAEADRHTAKGDAKATAQVLTKLIKTVYPDFAGSQRGKTLTHPHFPPRLLRMHKIARARLFRARV